MHYSVSTSPLTRASIITPPARYRYQPFQDNETIRLLALDPGQPHDPLTGSLEAVPVTSAGGYEAVSYVWAEPGPPNTAYEILVRDGDGAGNSNLLPLRGGSIFAALRQMRLPDRPRRLWADQCCINQDDVAERSQQVQFMDRIYRNATHVLVWLGLDTENEAEVAFGLVHALDGVLKKQYSLDTVPRHDPDALDLERHLGENHKTLQALAGRTWFKRGWVVQEIGTRTPATLCWGTDSIDWDTLASVCERLKGYHSLRAALELNTSDIAYLFRRFVEPDERTHHANRFNFVYELQRARHLNFSDDRDRVYAFLGHYSVRLCHAGSALGCGPLKITVDYTKSVEQTYVGVATEVIQVNPAAFCVVMAAVQHRRHSLPSRSGATAQMGSTLEGWLPDEHSLPSWVPDWRWSEGIILAEPICPHYAHGSSTANIEIVGEDSNSPVLRVRGLEIDTVARCSAPLLARDFYGQKSPDSQLPLTVERLWREICEKQRFNLADRYLDGQIAFFAFMQTLSNGCVQAAGHQCRPYDSIPERTWLRKAAQHVVSALGATADVVADDVRAVAVAEGLERESDHDKWSRWAVSASEGRSFARTERGYYVLGPGALEAGDVVCVLFGGKVPFCLRPTSGGRYLLVGECYVHGLMTGEAMGMLGSGELCEKTFEVV